MPIAPKSYLYLGGACIAGIAAVGSVFELSSGEPQLGTVVTSVILVLSVPLGGLLFVAAVRSAQGN